MARPTKLTKALIAKAKEYQSNWAKIDGSVIPTKEGLALYLGIARSQIYEWAELKTPLALEFQDIFESTMAQQGRTLAGHGLDGTFNSTITKLMLSKHGYVEKVQQEVEHTGNVQFINDVPRPDNADSDAALS